MLVQSPKKKKFNFTLRNIDTLEIDKKYNLTVMNNNMNEDFVPKHATLIDDLTQPNKSYQSFMDGSCL